MVRITLETGKKLIKLTEADGILTVDELWQSIEVEGFRSKHFYLTQNGRIVADEISEEFDVKVIPRLLGGKGGFGSMLRAIGAQIEKTTNREACRDLSGRRLRDINEEKRLKAWIEKQADREEEAAERKKKKLERLCAEPKHEFKDKLYEHERSILTERVDDAVEEGFKIAAVKNSLTEAEKKQQEQLNKKKAVKRKTILDDDIDSDELSSSDESESESAPSPAKKLATESNNSIAETKEDKPEGELAAEGSSDAKESSNQSSESEAGEKVNENVEEIVSNEETNESKK